MFCGLHPTVFDGMSVPQLQAALTAMQSAMIQLTTGQSVARVSIAQGEGTRDVTFRTTDLGTMNAMIVQLQQKLGLRPRRSRRRTFVYRS